MTAIEATLKLNKVVGINAIASAGQYMPLTVGVATIISVYWQLFQQEAVSTWRFGYRL